MFALLLAAAFAGPLPQAPPVIDEPKRIHPHLVYVCADWCGPCQDAKPTVERYRKAGWPFTIWDSDRMPQTCAKHGVSALPTYLLFDKQGNVIARHVGAMTEVEMVHFYRADRTATVPHP